MSRNEAHIYEIFYIANEIPIYNVDYSNGGKVNITLGDLIFKEYIKRKRRKIDIDVVLNMYNSGESIDDIASELDYSNEYIRIKLIELGIIKRIQKGNKDEQFEIFINCLKVLSNKIYFTIDDILNMFSDKYKCTYKTALKYYKEKFNFIIDKELEDLGLVKISTNKEIKDKYNIDVPERSYPKIIVRSN